MVSFYLIGRAGDSGDEPFADNEAVMIISEGIPAAANGTTQTDTHNDMGGHQVPMIENGRQTSWTDRERDSTTTLWGVLVIFYTLIILLFISEWFFQRE